MLALSVAAGACVRGYTTLASLFIQKIWGGGCQMSPRPPLEIPFSTVCHIFARFWSHAFLSFIRCYCKWCGVFRRVYWNRRVRECTTCVWSTLWESLCARVFVYTGNVHMTVCVSLWLLRLNFTGVFYLFNLVVNCVAFSNAWLFCGSLIIFKI